MVDIAIEFVVNIIDAVSLEYLQKLICITKSIDTEFDFIYVHLRTNVYERVLQFTP